MWIAMFSQTGSEIAGIIERTGKQPDRIITNNMDSTQWHSGIYNSGVAVMKASHKDIVSYLNEVKPAKITLHGYLRILPESVCDRHTIWNGHPGDIVKYPELKGKDPQKKALDLGLPSTGVVLHECIPEVDAGKIVRHAQVDIPEYCKEEQLISILKGLQLDLWVDLIEEIL